MEKCEELFDQYAGQDEEYNRNLILCEAAASMLNQKFGIKFGDPKPDAPSFNEAKLVGALFVTVYNTIIEKEIELRSSAYNCLKIDIYDIFSIGWTNEVNDENEKNGNFCPFIYHNNKPRNEEKFLGSKPMERITQYNIDHSDKQIEIDNDELLNIEKLSKNDKAKILQDIAVKAKDNLKNIDITILKSEAIMPIFAVIYDTVTQSISEQMKATKDFDNEVYFMSTIFIGANEDEDLGHVLYVRPNINDKLALKDDGIATSANE